MPNVEVVLPKDFSNAVFRTGLVAAGAAGANVALGSLQSFTRGEFAIEAMNHLPYIKLAIICGAISTAACLVAEKLTAGQQGSNTVE